MVLDIFEFGDYRQFLTTRIANFPNGGRGGKTALARAAECQPAYISQVLKNRASLSLEQAIKVATLFQLKKHETHFFLLLLQKDRAGTTSLRKFFDDQISEIRRIRMQVSEKNKDVATLRDAEKSIYYSSWHYIAVHMATTIPVLQTEKEIATHLRLREDRVVEVLQFLERAKLVRFKMGRYVSTNSRIHLRHDSLQIPRHHANWRALAAAYSEVMNEESLHYSSAVTLSREDFQRVRTILLNSIQNVKEKVKDSKEEIISGFSLDWFEIR